MHSTFRIAATSLVLLTASAAQAQGPTSTPLAEQSSVYDKHLTLEITGGLMPTGLAAATIQIAPARWFSFDVSLGTTNEGIVIGGEIRMRYPLNHWAPYVGFGVSGAVGDRADGQMPLFASTGVEYRFDNGLSMRIFGGALSTEAFGKQVIFPWAGTGIGYAVF